MKIAITGATGFIGRKLCLALMERGDKVIALTRDVQRARRVLPPETEVVAWDQSSEDGARLKLPADVVVNLAGETTSGRWTEKRKKEIYESRVVGTRKLVGAIKAQEERPRILISGSAIGYYGNRGDEILDEKSAPGRGFLADVCLAWENEAFKAEVLGLRVVCIRTGMVLGPRGGVLQAMVTPFKLGLGGPMGSGRQWMSWIHIDDEVGLILHALEDGQITGPLNATAPEPVTNREFARVLGNVLKRPTVMTTPAFALRLLLGEATEMVLGSQRVLPRKALATGYQFKYQSLHAALASLLRPSRA